MEDDNDNDNDKTTTKMSEGAWEEKRSNMKEHKLKCIFSVKICQFLNLNFI